MTQAEGQRIARPLLGAAAFLTFGQEAAAEHGRRGDDDVERYPRRVDIVIPGSGLFSVPYRIGYVQDTLRVDVTQTISASGIVGVPVQGRR